MSYDEHLISEAGGDGDTVDLERKLSATKFVLAERERELLMLKGHCSNASCTLHYAHSGPCR